MSRLLPMLLIAVAAPRALGEEAPAAGFRVVVNRENRATALEREFVSDAFLKRTTRWPDGSLIRPADLVPSAPARARFSTDVLGRSVVAVKSYWDQNIFAGRNIPPPELDSDDAVVTFVMNHPGAIGYVSLGADVTRVKVVRVR